MSAQLAFQSAAEVIRHGAHWLKVLPAAKSRATLPIIATAAVIVVIIMQLLMSVALADGAYETERLQTAQVQVQRDLTSVSGDLVRVQSPQYLANNATALGMISNANVVYLRLSDGAVFGVPTPADGRTLAGSNVANSLLKGVPLVTESKAAPAGVGSADAGAAQTGRTQGTQGTPTTAAGQSAANSVPLQGGFPAVHTR